MENQERLQFDQLIQSQEHKKTIDADKDVLMIDISDEEMLERISEWTNPIKPPKKGVLAKYAKSVKSASLGAITD